VHDHQIGSPKGITSLNLPQAPEGARTLENVKAYCTSIGLNPSQEKSLRSVVAGLLTTKPNPHVRLVQGPPGTGKTSMLVALLSVLGCLHRRTLISAPTNAAVIEIATRMMTNFFQDQGREQKKPFSKYCTENVKMQSTRNIQAIRQWSPLELREIVLVGSLQRLRGAVDGTLLTKVFLPHRADRLLAALRGWKDSLDSFVKFMEDAPGEYARTTDIEGQENLPNPIPNDPFWKFAGQFMKKMKKELEKSSSVLVSELPRCRLDERTSNAITKVCDLMKELVASMPSKAPQGAVSWFTATKMDILVETFSAINLGGVGKGISKTRFLEIKERLLEILISSTGRYLFNSENPLGCKLEGIWLQSLCLGEATLVFSTVSSAGGWQMRNIPFECGIVDEASQLVEAETTIITSITELKQLILVGDHKQLPATVISKVDRSASHHVPHNSFRISLSSSEILDVLLFCISRILHKYQPLYKIILDLIVQKS
jgi:DNA polymerase III delta prime subunit